MNQQQLIDKIEAATNGKVEEFKVEKRYKTEKQVGFYLLKNRLSANQILAFADDFTFHAIDRDKIYIVFTTKLLNND
jgi:hypothetical protein